MQRVVDNLVDDRQLELRANPDHTRAPLISLTSAGRDTLAAVIQNSEQNRGALLQRAGTTADELHAARRVLTRLPAGLRDQAIWRPSRTRSIYTVRRRSRRGVFPSRRADETR